MGSASYAVDSRTAQRLRSRRLLIVDAQVARAEAFVGALQAGGAAAVAVSPDIAQHDAAHALDPDVMLVNEDEPEACRPLVIALRRHPRTRWATVLPVSFASLWLAESMQPDVAAIAEEVNRHATSLTELIVRAKGKLPYETVLEPLGPSRVLRALGDTGRKLRLVLTDERMRAELELRDHRMVHATAVASDRALSDAEALAAVLVMSSGQLRIEDGTESKRGKWNVALPAAMEAAAALVWARAMSGHEPLAANGSGVRPAVSQRLAAMAQERAAATASRVQPLPEQRPTQGRATVPQIVVADADAEAEAMRAEAVAEVETVANVHAAEEVSVLAEVSVLLNFDEVEAPELPEAAQAAPQLALDPSDMVPPRPRAGGPARALVMTLALLLTAGGALAWLHARGQLPQLAWLEQALQLVQASTAEQRAREHAPQRAAAGPTTTTPEQEAAPATPAQIAPAQPEPAGAASPPREPTRADLEAAKRLTKRGHNYLRADHEATAASAYLKALSLAPGYLPAMQALVRVYVATGNAPEARRWAEQLALQQPDDAASQLLVGDAYALSGETEGARRAWLRAEALGNTEARERLSGHQDSPSAP